MHLLNRSTPDDFITVENDLGEDLLDPTLIEQEIVKFYKNFYENVPNADVLTNDSNVNFFDSIAGRDSGTENRVTAPLTETEMLATLRNCSDSAPGPDGIPYSLILALWPIMGSLLVASWNFAIETGNLTTSHKMSFLKLIPKIGKDLKELINWRSITLSNCDHKLITKIYAQRLSSAMAACVKTLDADIGLGTDLAQGLGQNVQAPTGDHLSVGHQRSIATVEGTHVPLNVGIPNEGKRTSLRHCCSVLTAEILKCSNAKTFRNQKTW